MTSCTRALRSLAAGVCLLVCGVAIASAQTATTGSAAGVVTDVQGGVLPGATVVATHTPTGTVYEAVTDSEGRFGLLNMRVGPYTIAVTMSGFKKDELTNVPITLGEQRGVDFKLQIETVVETVTVVGQSSIIDSSRAGTADNVSAKAVENLPTISRSFVDIARTSPYFNPTGLNNWIRWRSRWPDATTATTTCRSTAPSTTTSSASRRPARRAVRPKPSRSASTRSRSCSSSSRRTTCVRAGSRAAASTRSRRAARTTFAATALFLRPEPGLGRRQSDRHEGRPVQGPAVRRQRRRTDRRRTRRSSSATSTGAGRTTRQVFP